MIWSGHPPRDSHAASVAAPAPFRAITCHSFALRLSLYLSSIFCAPKEQIGDKARLGFRQTILVTKAGNAQPGHAASPFSHSA